ncbi:hypothetical protein FOXG_02581 [Fusarium oxysporum f. sp. lycopersici 4287]|uniref:Uncharacterized protein n=2 Tax=Fusarium oxysporum TaxID=5507 RepID=A0A0J9UFI8_FUSO4|nr:hypothetical protein FOXG_02581 [Fusarium oxysporum f. sp. lycopersici 4287]KNA98163.1 hypothetical protein FOXG_02581 [Fusarium oxysporum f. sp. lycopersici 4287]
MVCFNHGRMVWNFSKTCKVLGLSAWRVGQLFVILDIVQGGDFER